MTHPNRWRGAALGAIGGAVGTYVMGYAMQASSELLPSDEQGRPDPVQQSDALDEISVVGKHYRAGEGSTMALGRIVYTTLAGEEPQSDETRNLMSELVHWSFGIGMGALYGAARAGVRRPDIAGGMAFGTGVWLFASELSVPMLGLSPGPTTLPTSSHLQHFLGHLAYGATLALVSRSLEGVLGQASG